MTNVGLTPGTFDPTRIGPVELPFSEAEYRSRIARVREMMRERGIDLLWVTTPDAICWLHGYFTSWYKANSPMRYPQCYGTAIHAGSDRVIHFDNPTEMPVMARTSVCKDSRWLPDRRATPNIRFIMEQLAKEGWLQGTVGMEFWSYIPNRAIGTMFEGAFRAAGCEVMDASALLRRARRVKSAQEIAYIEKAVEICDIGHRTIQKELRPGITELDLFGAVTHAMMKAGGEFPALIPIFNAAPVIDGVPQQIGHSMASTKVIKAGELLVADLCGVYNRYHGNAMRGFLLGEPPKKLEERYRLAAGVYEVIGAELKAGMTVREVNRRLRRYYDEVGLWSETGGWALGYELGLSLPPDWVGDFYFNLGDDEFLDRVFEDGMVTNFESLFDTALIDTVVWRKDGCRLLSKIPLDLIAVG